MRMGIARHATTAKLNCYHGHEAEVKQLTITVDIKACEQHKYMLTQNATQYNGYSSTVLKENSMNSQTFVDEGVEWV